MPTALVNEIPYDFQSVETEIIANGATFGLVSGLDEFDYTVTINRTERYGAGRLPLEDPTEGDAEFDASITIHRDWFQFLLEQSAAAGIALAELKFTLAFTYYRKDTTLVTDTLTGCRLKEIGNSGSHGPDPQMVSMPLRVANIFFNGKDVFGNSL